jgi:hypothetical protein
MRGESGKPAGEFHPVLAGLGADKDTDMGCPACLLDDAKASSLEGFPADFLCGSRQGIECHDPGSGREGNADRVEEPGADKEDLVCSGILCRGKTAAKHLAPVRRPSPPFRNTDINPPLLQERFHCRDKVDVLDGGDEAHALSGQVRDGLFQHHHIEINLVGQEDDPVLLIDRLMTYMDEYVCLV